MKLGKVPCGLLSSLLSYPPFTWFLTVPCLGERQTATDYAEWEFQNAANHLNLFAPFLDPSDHTILDVGCGVGGKSVYLALQGAREVVAIDIDEDRINAARSFAESKSVENIRFEAHDASKICLPDNHFDLVLINDAFEHVPDPEQTLHECHRLLRPGGRIGLLFPPYDSPWGDHLFAHVRIPWAHHFCRDDVLIEMWQSQNMQNNSPENNHLYTARRADATDHATSIPSLMSLNQMTIRRFESILANIPLAVISYSLHVPGRLLDFLGRIPVIREYFVTRVVAVLEK